RHAYAALLHVVSPAAVVLAGAAAYASTTGNGSALLGTLEYVLSEATFGWDVWGLYIPLVVWCVWWPAWLVGSLVVLGQPATKTKLKSA
ncbi:hypothetical protein EKO27_g11916, partial [Xylaria grammica]